MDSIFHLSSWSLFHAQREGQAGAGNQRICLRRSWAGAVSIIATLGAALFLTTASTAIVASAGPGPDKPATVVFVCLHGSVKSQVAAAHFNRIAKERGLPFTAVSRGIAVDGAIPPGIGIRNGLAADGLDPGNEPPRGLTSEEANRAVKVFDFDDVPGDRKGAAEVTYWSDVSPATKDYKAARDAILRHIEDAVTALEKK